MSKTPVKVYIVAVADCSDRALKVVGWSQCLECKAWHLELSIKVLLVMGPTPWLWPCNNALALWRRGQYEYDITMLMDWSWGIQI